MTNFWKNLTFSDFEWIFQMIGDFSDLMANFWKNLTFSDCDWLWMNLSNDWRLSDLVWFAFYLVGDALVICDTHGFAGSGVWVELQIRFQAGLLAGGWTSFLLVHFLSVNLREQPAGLLSCRSLSHYYQCIHYGKAWTLFQDNSRHFDGLKFSF